MKNYAPIIVVVLTLLGWGLWNSRVEPQAPASDRRPGPTTPVSPALMTVKSIIDSTQPDDLPPHILVPESYWAQIEQKDFIFLDDGKGKILWQGTPKQFREGIAAINALAVQAGSKDTVRLEGREIEVQKEEQGILSDLLQGK